MLITVTRDDHLRVAPYTGQKHLHLGRGRVLHFVANDPRVVKGSTAHIGQRADLNLSLFKHRFERHGAKVTAESVKHGSSPRIHLLFEGSGKKAVLLIDRHGRTGHDYARDPALNERLGASVTCEHSFPGTCWACAYNYREGRREEFEISTLDRS